jgi:hypothetical protein
LAAVIYVLVPRIIAIISRGIHARLSTSVVIGKILRAVRSAVLPGRFPALIGKILLGTYVLDRLVGRRRPFGFFVSALTSAWVFFYRYKLSPHPDTTELTTVAFVRACDLVLHKFAKSHGISTSTFHSIADVTMFCASCFVIMFSWFYYPHRLPKSYRKWITKAASMDDVLVEALLLVRQGKLVYGEKGPYHDMLCDLSTTYGLDRSCGDFSKSVPIPCALVHKNQFTSCEMHALWRFYRGFITAMTIYIPLNAVLSLAGRKSWKQMTRKVVVSSTRSSAFLGMFIMLNWYSVCLVRTRLGPILFPNATKQQLEDTYGPGLGSLTCGLSSLLETRSRRGELALFVAPKAVTAVLPEGFCMVHRKLETTLFAVSFAVLAVGTKADPTNVRGFFRKLLQMVF